LFSLIFILGCIGSGQPTSTVNASSGEVSKGTFSAALLVNGKGTDTLTLLSEQSAQIGLQIQNKGGSDINNVKASLIGCINGVPTKDTNALMSPNSQDYFSWTVQAPTLSQSEIINCPLTIRICYDTTAQGYTDLNFIPDTYTGIPETPGTFSSSAVLGLTFDFPVIRVLTDGSNNVTGSLTITNIGPGWIDYSSYINNLTIYTLRSLAINITADKVKITKLRDLSESELKSGWVSNSGRTLNITTANAGDQISLLKLIQGNSLYLPIRLTVTDSSIYQSAPKTETLNVFVAHGYCLDLATIQTSLRGR
jgi:hypothetical protein